LHTAAFISLLASQSVAAEPWVDSSNIFLRVNIQYLADMGIIKTPVTSFPLMWHDIASDLKTIYQVQYDQQTQQAISYVKHQLQLAKRSQKNIKLSLANENKRFTSFGDDYREKNSLQQSTTFLSDKFAFKIATSYHNSPIDGDKIRLDGSYGAFLLGNWVFSAGMQDKWWGPGWDTSLSLSNNARPMPALTLSRKSALPLEIPFTEIKIPWTVTTFMAKMDDERFVKNTLLWGFRLNFKPIESLEIGISRLAQWAGDDRPSDLDTFWNVLKGLDNCGGNGPSQEECAAGQEPGNQLAGYDLRWSSSLFTQPFALYFTSFAEDGDRKGGLSILGEERYQVGFDTSVYAFDSYWKLYLEGTDTYAQCKDGNNGDGTSKIGDCYYEHHIYKTGMRYQQRSIGSIYENDATSVVLGVVSQSNSNTQYEFKLRWLQLNKDNHDKDPDNNFVGNTLTPIAEDMLMISTKVQHSYRNWRYTLGGDISQSTFDNSNEKDNNINVFFTIEYNL